MPLGGGLDLGAQKCLGHLMSPISGSKANWWASSATRITLTMSTAPVAGLQQGIRVPLTIIDNQQPGHGRGAEVVVVSTGTSSIEDIWGSPASFSGGHNLADKNWDAAKCCSKCSFRVGTLSPCNKQKRIQRVVSYSSISSSLGQKWRFCDSIFIFLFLKHLEGKNW